MDAAPKVPADVSIKLRALAHDLSNSLEAIMQASYLLGQTKLDEPSQQWMQLIEQACREAARINREIREVLRSSS
jgi:signal transduction histidine kinase